MGYLRASFWGISGLAYPCGVRSAGQDGQLGGRGVVRGTWCCGFLPSLLYTLPESGSKRRGHQPSGVGNGTSQRWEVSISCVLLSLLGTDQPSNDFVKWYYNGGVSPTAMPFTLFQTGSETRWQIPLPFTTKVSHFVVP